MKPMSYSKPCIGCGQHDTPMAIKKPNNVIHGIPVPKKVPPFNPPKPSGMKRPR